MSQEERRAGATGAPGEPRETGKTGETGGPDIPGDLPGRNDRTLPGAPKRRLGEILVDEGLVGREDLHRALALQKRRLGEILVEIGACKPEDLDHAIQIQRLGMTRAEIYGRYLRLTLVAIVVMLVGWTLTLLELRDQSQLLFRLEGEALTIAEVGQILGDPESPHKMDALRSLQRVVDKPEAALVIQQALSHDTWYVRVYALHLAARSGNEGLVNAILPHLTDTNEFVMVLAHSTLVSLIGQDLGPTREAWDEWLGQSDRGGQP